MTGSGGVGAPRRLGEWLASREPAAPAPLLERLGQDGDAPGDEASAMESLLVAARRALAEALAEEGERRGAFRLLAADAYVTHACEVALESEDPTSELLRVLDEVMAEAEDE